MNRIAVLVAILALGCSSSHHSDGNQVPVDLWGTEAARWGQVVCKDHCGCLPPKAFSIRDLLDEQAQDICGTPWDCHYRCSSDCR